MNIKKLLTFLSIIISCFVFNIEPIKLFASESEDQLFVGYSGVAQLSNEELEESTNTIKFTIKDYETNTFNYVSTNQTVGNDVGITILTHGLRSSATDWSNQSHYGVTSGFEFSYDSKSIIERLRTLTQGDVYLAKFESQNNFYLYKLADLREAENDITSETIDSIKYESSRENITSLTDISNHMIIVFQSSASYKTNDFVYNELNYLIDKIVYDYKYLNNGVLPKINLISHSRGGITNLQYAMDHPNLINQVFTMGTPFLGSQLGKVSFFMDLLKMDPTNPDNGEYDIMNEETYLRYKNRWNTYYNSLYSNISFHAIGSYVSLDYVYNIVYNDSQLPIFCEKHSINVEIIRAFVSTVRQLFKNDKNLVNAIQKDKIVEHIGNSFNSEDLITLSNVLIDLIEKDENKKYIVLDDLFIDLNSQYGTGYTGFIHEPRLFTPENADFTRLSQASPWLAHNLETRDHEIISYIIYNINCTDSISNTYITTEKSDGTLKIDYAYGISTMNGIIQIPSEINGKTVTEIGDYAFSNYNYVNGTIDIHIPSSITKIGKKAFNNCSFVESIVFEDNSNLQIIDYGAFENCDNLSNINIPDSVTKLSENAFSNCSSLTSVDLPSNLTDIYYNTFAGCDSLETLVVEELCATYKTINGVLYDKNVCKLVIYPCGKNDTTFTIPTTISELSNYSFNENKNIQSLNLSNTLLLREKALYNCTNLSTITGMKVEGCLENALLGTAWYNNQSSYVKLGKCFISYNGTLKSIPEYHFYGLKSIGSNAFCFTNVEEVVIPENIEVIYSNAFSNNLNLENVYLLGNCYVYNDAFENTNSNLNIHIQRNYITNYNNNSATMNHLNILSTDVTMNLNGSIYYDTFYYGESYTLPVLNSSGYTTYWYDENNYYYEDSGTWLNIDEELTLTAELDEHVKFIKDNTVLFEYDLQSGDTYSLIGNNIYINNSVIHSLDSPSMYYEYSFLVGNEFVLSGTYDDSFTSIIIKEIPIEYEVDIYSYKLEHINTPNDPETIIYTYENILTHGINFFTPGYSDEYEFVGLYLDSNYTNQINNVYQIITDNITTLYAKWELKEYTINYYNGTSLIETETIYATNPHLNLPEINETKNYYYSDGWIEKMSNEFFAEGDPYSVTTDTNFEINWVPITYSITYNNVNGANNPNITNYDIETETVYLIDLVKTNYNFVGWYTDSEFEQQIEYIEKGTHDDLLLYARWEIDYTSFRNETKTIQFENQFSNPYDVISIYEITGFTVEELISKGYFLLTIDFSLSIWEERDGNQFIYIYNEYNSNAIPLYVKAINHGNLILNTTPSTYSFSKTINLSDLSGDSLYVLYSVTGSTISKWNNNNMSLNIYSLQEQTTHSHNYNDYYVWKDSTKHYAYCLCNGFLVQGHAVVSGGNICIQCGGRADVGFIEIMSNSSQITLYSQNGSYILPNGIIVLVEEDIEAYLNGTLEFLDKSHEIMVLN